MSWQNDGDGEEGQDSAVVAQSHFREEKGRKELPGKQGRSTLLDTGNLDLNFGMTLMGAPDGVEAQAGRRYVRARSVS